MRACVGVGCECEDHVNVTFFHEWSLKNICVCDLYAIEHVRQQLYEVRMNYEQYTK